jgi:phage-related protein
MNKKLKMISALFYTELSGNQPVRDWLIKLDDDSRIAIGRDIMTVEFRWPIGAPFVKSLGKGLWEVRSSLENTIARVIFIIEDGHMILLHGFIKKTQKTPIQDIEIALERARNYKARKRDEK